MKTVHIHISVQDIEKSVHFYSSLFGIKPTKLKSDYAKWMLDDPKMNFAISNRSSKQGLDHLGIQVDSESELNEISQRIQKAEQHLFKQGVTECCYAKSNKVWLEDPAGIAWEAYETMEDVEVFGPEKSSSACCAPKMNEKNSCC